MINGIDAPIVSPCTVTFFRATTTFVDVGSPAMVGAETAASLSAGGLLSYRPDLVSEVSLATGTVLRGIQALDVNGDPIEPDALDDRAKPLIMLRAQDGGYASVIHDDPTIPTTTDRLSTAYGVDITIGADAIQVFWSENGAARNWRCPHWALYVPGTPADWAGTPPATPSDAIDRLAAAFNAQHGPVT